MPHVRPRLPTWDRRQRLGCGPSVLGSAIPVCAPRPRGDGDDDRTEEPLHTGHRVPKPAGTTHPSSGPHVLEVVRDIGEERTIAVRRLPGEGPAARAVQVIPPEPWR